MKVGTGETVGSTDESTEEMIVFAAHELSKVWSSDEYTIEFPVTLQAGASYIFCAYLDTTLHSWAYGLAFATAELDLTLVVPSVCLTE